MKFRQWLEVLSSSDGNHDVECWHITDLASARHIMQNGFEGGHRLSVNSGISVSVSRKVALGMLRSVMRMNSFKSYDEVVEFFRDKLDDIDAQLKRYIENYGDRGSPPHFYLFLVSVESPRIPQREILWVDFAKKLIGKPVVAVNCSYMGDPAELTRFKTSYGDNDVVEAEYLVKDPSQLKPNYIFSMNQWQERIKKGRTANPKNNYIVKGIVSRLSDMQQDLLYDIEKPETGLRKLDLFIRDLFKNNVFELEMQPLFRARQYLVQNGEGATASAAKHIAQFIAQYPDD